MDAIALLKDLVSIDSIFPNEQNIAKYVERKLTELDFKVKKIAITQGRYNIVGERGSEGRPILFYGHLDTVPAYGKWESNPHSLVENGDRLIGLGAFDMKSGVAAILKACETKTNRTIKVVFAVDEENISEGAHAIVKSGFLKDVDVGISTESPDPLGPKFGPQVVSLGRRGRCVIEIGVPGLSAHGANPELGKSAISDAARLVIELEKLNLQENLLLPKPTHFIRKIVGESTSLSIPDRVVIELDVHMVPPDTPQTVLEAVNQIIEKCYSDKKISSPNGVKITARLKQRKTPYGTPYVTDKDNTHVKRISEIIQGKYGKVHYNYGMSVADENIFAAAGVPMIVVGPSGANEHSANEWVSKKSYLELIEVLKAFIES
ncbi:[LysW]-lysine/[LysW]-ornithine hydrolase [Candidatus Bilamarchaeum dharawalense]|uniref:[LysW]-lysine/[LysW]-ornithine hydrolase n=1 Tax=Candidatus Bilamarchaeum dharawalense TaxID=2885759 RepID=A0A5E4LRN7_9ARCH|nr:[LysW]-lysine/[LysW]-ornithine hydrolase [Candidatus Bilamarchaeum dharawalense]